MDKIINLKQIIATIILIIIALTSFFAISPKASSAETYKKTIASLDEKKMNVMEITAATAGASAILAVIPSDATTPIANQVAKLSTYLLIVIATIFFEKILLTLTGYVTFSFLIPIACVLAVIYIFSKFEVLKKLAIKLAVFGLVIFMVVPVSVQVSNLIENTYNETIESAKSTEFTANDAGNTENTEAQGENEAGGGWSGLVSKFKDGIANIGNNVSELVKKGEKTLSNFIDAIAILLITSCVIPILVLVFLIWIVKMIFGVNIQYTKIKKIESNKEAKNNEEKIC